MSRRKIGSIQLARALLSSSAGGASAGLGLVQQRRQIVMRLQLSQEANPERPATLRKRLPPANACHGDGLTKRDPLVKGQALLSVAAEIPGVTLLISIVILDLHQKKKKSPN